MAPNAGNLIWEGLKKGMVIWPFPVSHATYFFLPIYVVVPALLILVAVVAIAIHLMSTSPKKISS